jgi:hypothetical protein
MDMRTLVDFYDTERYEKPVKYRFSNGREFR